MGAACSAAPKHAPAPTIRPGAVMADVSFLSSRPLQGREAGESGCDMASRYIAAAFRRAGLRPVGAATNREGRGYFQWFRFSAGNVAEPGARLTAAVGGARQECRQETDFDALPASAGGQVQRAEVVPVTAAQLMTPKASGPPLAGKAALLFLSPYGDDGPAGELAGEARQRGASALFVAPDAGMTDASFRRATISLGAAEAVYGADAGIPVVRLSRALALAWQASGAGGSPARVTLSLRVRRAWRMTANVLGLLPGRDARLRREVVVIGAHYDHLGLGGPASLAPDRRPQVHPGADDNASGTAGVLEMAKYFAGLPPLARPRRSLLFVCFSAEEKGLLGSAAYLHHPVVPLARTAAMLNMDMVGRLRGNRLIVGGTRTSPAWAAILDAQNRMDGFALARDTDVFGGSDHLSFYGAKIPVLFFFTGLHGDYHRPTDTADKVNGPGAAHVIGFVAGVARSVADLPLRPGFRREPRINGIGRPRTRARVALGTVPDYGADVVGVRLGGVRAGSPAERAGLRPGDLLTGFDGFQIRNVEEYAAALSAHEPGDVVSLVVKRQGRTLTLKATLEPRARR